MGERVSGYVELLERLDIAVSGGDPEDLEALEAEGIDPGDPVRSWLDGHVYDVIVCRRPHSGLVAVRLLLAGGGPTVWAELTPSGHVRVDVGDMGRVESANAHVPDLVEAVLEVLEEVW